MVLNFLLPWSQLNLFSLSSKQQKYLANLNILLEFVTYFEYEKTKKRYWIGEYY